MRNGKWKKKKIKAESEEEKLVSCLGFKSANPISHTAAEWLRGWDFYNQISTECSHTRAVCVCVCGPNILAHCFSFAKNSRCFLALLFIVFYDHLYSSILYWFADAELPALLSQDPGRKDKYRHTHTYIYTYIEGNEFWCLDSTLPVALPIRKQHLTNLWAIKTAAEILRCWKWNKGLQ